MILKLMVEITPLRSLLIVFMIPLLNACTTTLPDATERRDPVDRSSRQIIKLDPITRSRSTITKPISRSRPDTRYDRRNSPAITQPYRPAQTRPQTSPTRTIRPADRAESGVNPYDKIPQSRQPVSARGGSRSGASPAVRALLLRAKVDVVSARYGAGASRLERALRIEPRNPEIWHQLAIINYKQKKYASSITMAQKSNNYTTINGALEKANWSLIKQASKAAGDIKTLKKAIQYERSHP